jgi:hypothetical protein
VSASRGIASALVLVLAAAAAASPATRPATRPAAEPAPEHWGEAVAGAQVALLAPAAVRRGRPLTLTLFARNVGLAPVAVPAGSEVFAWLLLQQQSAETTSRHYSQRVSLPAEAWPRALPAEGGAFRCELGDVSGRGVHPYTLRKELLAAYVTDRGLAGLPRPAKKVGDVLSPGTIRARLTLLIRRGRAGPILLRSNVVEITVLPPDFSALSAAEREAFMAELLAQFDRSAWGGQAAHHTAVAVGRAIVPDLVKAAFELKRPWHSRMWLATALADIRDARSAAALVKLLDDRLGGVRQVAAYHGTKQRDAALDEAIVARSVARKDAGMIARALVGFMVFRGRAPEDLLRAGLDSPEPRVRAAVANALTKQAGDFNLSRLAALLKDKDERVRSAAARAIGEMKRPADRVLAALVAALDEPGEQARASICRALATLTGKQIDYDGDAPEAQRREAIRAWKRWWEASRHKEQ